MKLYLLINITVATILITTIQACKKDKKEDSQPTTYTDDPSKVTVTTISGSDDRAYADTTLSHAKFLKITCVAIDASGIIYLGDGGTMIRKVANNMVSTVAGSMDTNYRDGQGSTAAFAFELGNICFDKNGNLLFSDFDNHCIRKITPSGLVTTIAGIGGESGYSDGPALSAKFTLPADVAVDGAGNIYVADYGNNCIRKITTSGVVSTVAGDPNIWGADDGQGSSAKFRNPTGITLDNDGNLVVADYTNNLIRRVTPAGVVTTIAGGGSGYANGNGTSAKFDGPLDVVVDAAGNILVSDVRNHSIRKITADNTVSTMAGTGAVSGYQDGLATSAKFYAPWGMSLDNDGNILVADVANNRIRKISGRK